MKIANDKLGNFGFKRISPPAEQQERAPRAPASSGQDEVQHLRAQFAKVVEAFKLERAKRLRLAELLRPFIAQVQAAQTPGRAYRSDGGAPAAPASSTALAPPQKPQAQVARVPDEVLPPEDDDGRMEEGDDPSDDLEDLLDG